MDKIKKTSLQTFIESIDPDEKELLSEYIKQQDYEILSKKFDSLLNPTHEDK